MATTGVEAPVVVSVHVTVLTDPAIALGAANVAAATPALAGEAIALQQPPSSLQDKETEVASSAPIAAEAVLPLRNGGLAR